MIFDKFLDEAKRIVAEHKAQYHGVYYMKGGVVGSLEDVAGDVGATLLGQPELIPLINAGVSAANGGGWKGALEAGGEALAGQELAGAVGIGSGNSAFNNAFGITGDNPAGTGLPNIGSAISTGFGGVSNALDLGSDNAGTYGTTPSTGTGIAAPTTTPSAASGGGGISGAGGASAPPSLDTQSLDPSNFSTLNGGTSSPASVAQDVGSTATTGNTLGTPSIPDLAGATGNAGTYGQAIPPMSAMGTVGGATGAADNFAADVNGIPASLQSSAAAASGAGGATGGAQANPLTDALKGVVANPTSLSSYGNLLTASPSADIAAAGLGVDALKEGQMVKGQRQLQQEAGQQAAQGAQLESYLQSGTLPPGLQAGVNQATQSVIASIKSQYAAKGMSGSSAEAQDIASAQANAQAQGAQMAMQLLNTGIQETGMSSELYKAIMGNALAQDQQLGSAISGFAQAAAGGNGGQKIVLQTGSGGTI